MAVVTPEQASAIIQSVTPAVCDEINKFSHQVLRTRGGRIGSGMGTLLEALWGYYSNLALAGLESTSLSLCELVWLINHEYNDFACIQRDIPWSVDDKSSELLRVEAKSMNKDADESKAHFDELVSKLGQQDLLLVLVWSWVPVDNIRVYPKITDHFIDSALSVARLRDCLHLLRGGTFVDRKSCPDGCSPETCLHQGEPLNSAGKRERETGPITRKPANVSHAANFGGLVRMMKLRQRKTQQEAYRLCSQDTIAQNYVSFFERNFSSRFLLNNNARQE